MTTISSLEDMGLTLSFTPDGGLALDGLKGLSPEKRAAALLLAREHKVDILDELWRREVAAVKVPDYAGFCDRYWRECQHCPDCRPDQMRFCERYNREMEAASGVAQ